MNGARSHVYFLSCLDNKSRRRAFITISDDSDEELAIFRPNVPVVVKDDDDDDDEDEVSILEVVKTVLLNSPGVYLLNNNGSC